MISTTHTFKTEGNRPTANWGVILDVCLREILSLPVMSSITIWRAVKDTEAYLPYYMIYTNYEGQVRRQAIQKD